MHHPPAPPSPPSLPRSLAHLLAQLVAALLALLAEVGPVRVVIDGVHPAIAHGAELAADVVEDDEDDVDLEAHADEVPELPVGHEGEGLHVAADQELSAPRDLNQQVADDVELLRRVVAAELGDARWIMNSFLKNFYLLSFKLYEYFSDKEVRLGRELASLKESKVLKKMK